MVKNYIILFFLISASLFVCAQNSDTGYPTDLMITQYYENGDQDFIEIKNLTDKEINGGKGAKIKYYLVYYKSNEDINKKPKKGNHIEIKLNRNEVKVYDNFNLEGDEIVLISTEKNDKCFDNRIDIIGMQGSLWGQGVSYSRGACASEIANEAFVTDDWISLSTTEVDNASDLQNIDLGTYQLGSINWDGTTWTDGHLPDRTRTVIINKDKIYTNINGKIEACDLIVNGELNYRNAVSNKSVIVYRDLNISDITGTFKLGDKMSLVMYDDDAEISGDIIKYEKSTKLSNQFDFTYWSSPVKAANVANVFSGVRSGRVYYFDQSESTASDPDNDPDGTYWNVWVPANGEMKPGRGYASEGSKDSENRHFIEFEGQPNNGVIREQVHYNDDDDNDNDWNLIGNPYPSAINIDLFLDKNIQFIDPTIYLWTHATAISEESPDYSPSDYVIYNKTGGTGAGDSPKKNIGSGQGFMIRVDPVEVNSDIQVEFNNSMRLIDSNDQFFKSSIVKKRSKENEKDRIWVDLTTDQGGFNQLLIGFVEGATSEFDRGYDSFTNQGANKISFYTLLDNKKLAIQGMGLFESRAEIALGFDTQLDNRTYTIAVSTVEGKLRNAEIILHDHVLNLSHDLTKSNYKFDQVEQGSSQDRFSLTFIKEVELSNELAIKEDQFLVYNEEDTFRIEATEKVATVRIYDLYGNIILEAHPDNISFEVFEPTSNRGDVLLMQIIHADQSDQIKKIYKR